MLQDLDSLTARIERLVEFTQHLQADRSSLLARIKVLEDNHNRLQQHLLVRETDFNRMSQAMAEHEAGIQAIREQSDAALEKSQKELQEHKEQQAMLEHKLEHSQANIARLSVASEAALEQINAVLERLPGSQE